mmetsp:Transcript_18464/g.33928  ORF Transcript_18464/g.33928 Transcript_18464/m.33928 type:complete len:165 (-) Transcript_18464:6-500(-)
MRHNAIIEHTTSRIASNNQFEVFLKVKQATNTDFSFLTPSDELHRYYLYLKEKHSNNGKNANVSTNNHGDSRDENASVNPLSGLLGDYESSSDESTSLTKNDATAIISDKSNGKIEENQHQDEGKGIQVDSQSCRQDKKRKAERMERFRLWKASRLEQKDEIRG